MPGDGGDNHATPGHYRAAGFVGQAHPCRRCQPHQKVDGRQQYEWIKGTARLTEDRVKTRTEDSGLSTFRIFNGIEFMSHKRQDVTQTQFI